MIKKIWYMIRHGYNPYPMYWFDLLTERHLKHRVGECIDCLECCKYGCNCVKVGSCECYCSHVDIANRRCLIYDKRTCDIWFPISQKELDYMASVKPGFTCKYKFTS